MPPAGDVRDQVGAWPSVSRKCVVRTPRAGASGFLLKDAPEHQLLAAIRVVADGGGLFAPSVTRRVIEQFALLAEPKNRRRGWHD
jgi:DNA-binding NarL/FixJ family response regulator